MAASSARGKGVLRRKKLTEEHAKLPTYRAEWLIKQTQLPRKQAK
jgi:hypothetical protein